MDFISFKSSTSLIDRFFKWVKYGVLNSRKYVKEFLHFLIDIEGKNSELYSKCVENKETCFKTHMGTDIHNCMMRRRNVKRV